MHHRYNQTELNPDCLTLKEAITKGNHIENECWINTLMEHYADTLMRRKRTKKKNLTRERILEIINKSDENFKKHGASIMQMDAVFKQFDIKARIYDIDSNLIYKHDPKDFYGKQIITFNGLVKNSHIYTLNHDLVRLKANPNVEDVHKLKTRSKYYTSSRETPIKYKMIENLDDILNSTRKMNAS